MDRTERGPRSCFRLRPAASDDKRMKQADLRFLSEAPVNVPDDALAVADECWDIMRAPVADRVPAVAPYIADEEIETVGEPRPEGIVGIDGKPVAVAQNEPRAVRVAVPPDGDRKAVGRTHLKYGDRFGNIPARRNSHPVFESGRGTSLDSFGSGVGGGGGNRTRVRRQFNDSIYVCSLRV